jgi:hypothetical protein
VLRISASTSDASADSAADAATAHSVADAVANAKSHARAHALPNATAHAVSDAPPNPSTDTSADALPDTSADALPDTSADPWHLSCGQGTGSVRIFAVRAASSGGRRPQAGLVRLRCQRPKWAARGVLQVRWRRPVCQRHNVKHAAVGVRTKLHRADSAADTAAADAVADAVPNATSHTRAYALPNATAHALPNAGAHTIANTNAHTRADSSTHTGTDTSTNAFCLCGLHRRALQCEPWRHLCSVPGREGIQRGRACLLSPACQHFQRHRFVAEQQRGPSAVGR